MEAILYIVAAVSLFAIGYITRGIIETSIIRSVLDDLGEIIDVQSGTNEATAAYIHGMLDMIGELQDRGL